MHIKERNKQPPIVLCQYKNREMNFIMLKRVGYDCGFLSARTKWSGLGIGEKKLTFVVTMHECYEIY